MEEVSEKVEFKSATSGEPAAFSPGFLLADKFEIKEKLGEGGMATVYRARQISLGRDVAVKVLHGHLNSDIDTIKRFDKEARAVGALKHHNLVGVVDNGVFDGSPYLIMDYIEGTRLTDLLERERLSWEKFRGLADQLCAGLAHAHHNGLVHRDLKPSNIMLTEENGILTPKIVDFGIAKSTKEDLSDPLTHTGEIFGTPFYMSPEQCQGHQIDQRSDIYSLGCLFFQMLDGEMPFVGASPIATVIKHLNEEVPTINRTDIPQHVQVVIARAMAKSPDDRFQTVQEFMSALNDPSIANKWRSKSKSARKGNWSKIGAIIMAIVVIAAGAGLVTSQINSQAPQPSTQVGAPNSFEYIKDQADKAVERHDFQTAIPLYEKLMQIAPESPYAPFRLAEIYSQEKFENIPKSISLLNSAIKLDKSSAELFKVRGEAYFRNHQYSKALGDLTKALQLKPDSIEILPVRGKVFHQLHKDEDAIRDYTAFLPFSADNPEVLVDRAISRWSLKEYDAAISDLSRALEVRPDYVHAYVTRSAVYQDVNKAKEAERDAIKALTLSPDNHVALNNLGWIEYRAEHFASARAHLDKALRINPGYAEAYASRGDLRFDTGDVKGAISDYEHALKIDKTNGSALTGKAYAMKHPEGGTMPQNRATSTAESMPDD